MRPVAAIVALVACTGLQAGVTRRDAGPEADPCGAPCSLGRTCVSGRCTAAVCMPGRADCDRDEATGCEVTLASDARHCGACGRACALPHATAICVAGACRVGACAAGRGDCDGDAANGCERDLAADPARCGRCDVTCGAAHASAACEAGVCATPACDPGFGDCDDDLADGCEVALATSVAHCGACGARCPAPVNGVATCVAGRCASACAAGFEEATGACLPRGAPRLVAPLSTGVVGSWRPTLRWALGADTDGVELRLCRDRAMTRDCRSQRAAGSTARVADALARGAWFWRAQGRRGGVTLAAASATWSFVVGARDAASEGSAALSKDLDGDGFDDVAVGASHVDAGAIQDVGALSVFPGGPAGPRAGPPRVFLGALPGDVLGWSAATAGDLDGDGFADLAVGVPRGLVGPQSPDVRVYRGGATGLAGPPRVLPGRPGVGRLFVVSAGDVNGDGFGDLAVLGALRVGGEAAAAVFWGGDGGLAAAPSQGIRGADVTEIAGASDLQRDGFADLVIGLASADPGGRVDAGAVAVHSGSAAGLGAGPTQQIEGDAPGDRMGYSVAMLGDTDGDGWEDFAVGAPGARGGAGRVRVYAGRASAAALGRTIDGEAGDALGTAVARVGDVNGDGFADLAVAAPDARGGFGRVAVYLGGPSGVGVSPARVWEGDARDVGFGAVVVGLGDVNGDGYADLAIAERGRGVAMTEGVGRVRVFAGSAVGPAASPTWVLEGVARNDYFGTSVAHAAGAVCVWRAS